MPDEGGGSYPPFRESFLARIVNVHWGGGVGGIFVSGDFCCFQRYARIETPTLEQEWHGLGPLDFSPSGGTYASSYAKIDGTPTILIGGTGPYDPHNYGVGFAGIVMLSNNGVDWISTLKVWEPNSNNGAVDALVWDRNERAFYADVDVVAGADVGRRLYRSTDGYDWARIDIGNPRDENREPFMSHCNGAIPGTEDGVYGYDQRNDVLIQPHLGRVIRTIGGSSEELSVGLQSVSAVAYVGGIWVAVGDAATGGRGGTASSIDSGDTWTVVSTGPLENELDFGIMTVIGAPLQDFK